MTYRDPGCSDMRELVAARELGLEIDAGERAALDRHLAACGECRRFQELERRMSGLLESKVRSLAGDCESLGARIVAALPERVAVPARRARSFKLEAVAALILFGVGLGVGSLFRGDGRQGPAGEGGFEPPGPSVPAVYVGTEGFQQKVSPQGARTSGVKRYRFVDPRNPDVIIEIDLQSYLEDPSPAVDYR